MALFGHFGPSVAHLLGAEIDRRVGIHFAPQRPFRGKRDQLSSESSLKVAGGAFWARGMGLEVAPKRPSSLPLPHDGNPGCGPRPRCTRILRHWGLAKSSSAGLVCPGNAAPRKSCKSVSTGLVWVWSGHWAGQELAREAENRHFRIRQKRLFRA